MIEFFYFQTMFDTVKEQWHRQQKVSPEDLQLFTMCNQDQVRVFKRLSS